MTVFNDQAHIQIGGQWNENLRRVERPFRGILAGVTFNGLRPLDLAANSNSDGKIKLYGDANKLNNIPFDYKERHPELFTKDAIKLMIDKIYTDKHNGAVNHGHGAGGAGLQPRQVRKSPVMNLLKMGFSNLSTR